MENPKKRFMTHEEVTGCSDRVYYKGTPLFCGGSISLDNMRVIDDPKKGTYDEHPDDKDYYIWHCDKCTKKLK